MKFYASTWISFAIAAIICLSGTYTVTAQSDFSSPYSIFGPGTPIAGQSVLQAGFGGSGVALIEPYQINRLNPAMSAFSLDPVFQVSGMAAFSTFETATQKFDNKRFMLNQIAMSLPIRRNVWGLNVGLEPLTNIGYDVVVDADGGEEIGTYRTHYSGSGGINRFYIGTAYKLFSRADSASNITALAAGIDYNYNFGTIESNRQISYPDSPSTLGLLARETFVAGDDNLSAGLHFQTNLIKRTRTNPRFLKLLVGASGSVGSDMSVRRDAHVYSFNYVNDVTIIPADTLTSTQGEDGSLRLPRKYTLGFALDYFSVQRRRIRFSADYSAQDWSAYKVSFSDHSLSTALRNSQRFSAGLEYTPEIGSREFFQALRYRVGFNYEKSNLVVDNTGLEDVGMGFGLTVPINLKRSLTNSTFNIAGRYGVYGTEANGLIKENYFHVYVGFSFTPHFRNRWFVQPKYD